MWTRLVRVSKDKRRMDATCSLDLQHSLLPHSSLNATVSTADMEDLQKTQNVQQESSTPPANVQDETRKQAEVLDGALTSTGALDSTGQCPGISPTVGAYTAQCAMCMKWRFIPTKAHFEAIRHSILERPFVCSSATPWRPRASCNDPFEISPDMHELWAFDKPCIPSPPDGWERLLVIRPVGSIKFADVYYVTPSGKRLRSMPEIDRFLSEHPEYGNGGLKPSQFSFLIPRPLDKDYCKKKNESLTCGDKSTTSEKAANSKSLPADSPSSKLGVMQPSLKVVSSKPPKLEKLKFRKKVVSGVSGGGEFQVLHSEERSCNTLAFQQAVMSPSMSQVAITPDTNGPNPVAGSKENEASTVGNCAESASLTTGIMSKDQHGMAR